ncbi:MAG: hypothetical protein R2727_06730 [Bacteroidales bacterium]
MPTRNSLFPTLSVPDITGLLITSTPVWLVITTPFSPKAISPREDIQQAGFEQISNCLSPCSFSTGVTIPVRYYRLRQPAFFVILFWEDITCTESES